MVRCLIQNKLSAALVWYKRFKRTRSILGTQNGTTSNPENTRVSETFRPSLQVPSAGTRGVQRTLNRLGRRTTSLRCCNKPLLMPNERRSVYQFQILTIYRSSSSPKSSSYRLVFTPSQNILKICTCYGRCAQRFARQHGHDIRISPQYPGKDTPTLITHVTKALNRMIRLF